MLFKLLAITQEILYVLQVMTGGLVKSPMKPDRQTLNGAIGVVKRKKGCVVQMFLNCERSQYFGIFSWRRKPQRHYGQRRT
jgi:hypothetical protein